MSKKVLWVSRHTMLPEQLDGLNRLFGEPVQVTTMSKTFSSVKEVLAIIEGYDAVAAVLPTWLWAGVWAACPDKLLLVPKSKRSLFSTANGGDESYAFEYDGWSIIRKCIFECDHFK